MSSFHVMSPDIANFRTVLGHFATGVALVTATNDGEPVGMACNAFTSVSLDPPLVLFCAMKTSTTWPKIQAAGSWAANFVGEDDEELCRLFAQKDADRFARAVESLYHDVLSPVLDGTGKTKKAKDTPVTVA